jgi:hypothetical protein
MAGATGGAGAPTGSAGAKGNTGGAVGTGGTTAGTGGSKAGTGGVVGTGGTTAGTGGSKAGTGGTTAGTGGMVAGTGGVVGTGGSKTGTGGITAGTGGMVAGTGGTTPGTGGTTQPPPVSSSVAAAAQACASMPLSTTGTVYYACDCGSGADASCKAGNDASDGKTPATAWRTYQKAQAQFSSLNAGDTIAFCRGGSFTGNTNVWSNTKCKAGTPCTVRDYVPSGGSASLPAPKLNGAKFNLWNNGNAIHEEGLQILNLAMDGGGTVDFGVLAGNDISDMLICNVSFNAYGVGVYFAGSNPPNAGSDGKNYRLVLRGSKITNSTDMGFLGACTDCAVEYNLFDHNGDANALDHDIYVGGVEDGNKNYYTATGERVIGNELYHAAQGTGNLCVGNPLVVHGNHDGLVVEGNFIHQDIGTADNGCWGIAVGPGYPNVAESFKNVVVTGNTIENVGNISILMASCQNCVVENNLIIQGQTAFGSTGIQAHYNGSRESVDQAQTAVQILNNTIYFNTPAPTNVGINVGLEGSNYVIASNVIIGAGSTQLSCLNYDLATSAYYSDYNDCWTQSGGLKSWDTHSSNSLAAWQSSTGLDKHSKNVDPMVKAAAMVNYDFHPASGSPLIGAADPTHSAKTDYAGNQRPSPADIGAFQH